MKSDSWLTLSALKGCSLHAPCLWPCVLCCPQPRSHKNSPLKHKYWPSRSHLTANPKQSHRNALRRRLWRTLAHSSYAYPVSARSRSSDVILNVFLAMSLLSYCTQEQREKYVRSKKKVLWCKRSLSGTWVQKSHKKNLTRVYIWYRRKKSKNEINWCEEVTGIYLHKVPYIDHFFVSVQVLVKYITMGSVTADLCSYYVKMSHIVHSSISI